MDELLQYQKRTQDAEDQLLATQRAFQQLNLSQGNQPPRQSVLRQAVSRPSYVQILPGPYMGPATESLSTPVHHVQSGFKTVVGVDGRRYMVPKNQLTQIPDYEIVTGSDGRQYKVARSQLNSVQNTQQQPTQQLVPQQAGAQSYKRDESNAYPWQYTPQQLSASHQLPGQHGSGSSVSEQIREKMQGIVNLVDGEGVRKPSKLMDYVRKCPARWCRNVKKNNMNLPVFAYGAISELTASISGRADPLSAGVLLSKLCHLQNVFEICCINSTEADLTGYGWTLARDYALKVNERVDQQLLSWGQISHGIQTDILVSSQMEFPRPAKVDTKEKNPANLDKPLCSTFNKCTVEGKCDWEVSNPGRACQRRHECSYCRKSKNQNRKHQESRCASKAASFDK